MTIRLRTVLFLVLGIISIWFLYSTRAVLTPFIIAAIFAYVCNPIVNFFYVRVRLPRLLSIGIIYVLIISLLVFTGILLTQRIISESFELRSYIDSLHKSTKVQVNGLPGEIRPMLLDTLNSLDKSKMFSPERLFSFFPQAISRIVSFFIFLFSSFYFLKEGKVMIKRMIGFLPKDFHGDAELLLQKITVALAAYLRGQLFMVFFVSLITFVVLSIIGVRFALILALFSGFVEIIPIIGPLTAGAVAVIVVLAGGTANFDLTPIAGALLIVAVYFIIRHVQDYFIAPAVMSRITNIHPLLILFAVLAGGHVWGLLGLVLAVPVAAIIKILLEYAFGKMQAQTAKKS